MNGTTMQNTAVFAFPFMIFVIFYLVYYLQRKSSLNIKEKITSNKNGINLDESLVAVLQMEFDYISKTASEAMNDRHSMINFYIAIITVAMAGVTNILTSKSSISLEFAVVLLWMGCLVGVFYFLKIVRLRQAWVESIKAMNCIKRSIIEFSGESESQFLKQSFLWKSDTAPMANQHYNIFHYSAMFIGFMSAFFYVLGVYIMYISNTIGDTSPFSLSWALVFYLAIGFVTIVWMHHKFYDKFLTESKSI